MLLLLAAVTIPLGLDLYMPVPEENPLTAEKIALGRRLFFDRRLSRDGSIACSSCHDPERAFSDGRAIAEGVFGRQGRRNAPALINRGYGRSFFWDGRAATLEEQVLKPIQDPNEMDLTLPEAASRTGLPAEEISRALASYVRSILSGDSPSTASSMVTSTRSRPSSKQACSSSAERRTAWPATSVRTSPMSASTTPASLGATASSLIRARGRATSKRRHSARSREPRPTCTTAASPHSKT